MRWFSVGLLLTIVVGTGYGETPEHRGLWMGTDSFNTPEKVDAAVVRAAAAHLNAVYPLVWYNGGQAWYRSSLSPLAAGVPEGFDPLGYLVRTAHAKGIAVHAWFVNGSYGWAEPGHVFDKHPDWALQTGRKTRPQWYDLGKPEVRQFETEVMLDCLRHYEVDGLHFDYIRYDSQQYCYCDHCRQEFAHKYGLPPPPASGKLFPIAQSMSGNPLAGPTTAQVLASFQDGVPAIALNKLGQGEAALLNWQAERTASPAVDDTVSRLLQQFGATKDNVYQLRTTQTAAKYSVESQATAAEWITGLGFRPKVIDETQLSQVPTGGTVFLYGQYYIPEDTCAWLKQFVSVGGHCLFIDGPVFAIKSAALQEVIGMKTTASYFSAVKIIAPAAGQDFLKSGPALNVEQ